LTTEQQKIDNLGGNSKDNQTDTYRLGDLIDTIGGGTPKTDIDEYWGGDNLWLTPSEVSDEENIHISDTDRKLTDKGLSNTSAKILPPGSVLMTSRATVGVPVMNTEPMATNQGFIGTKITHKDQLNNYYLLYWLKNKKSLIMNHASGSTYPEISQRSFNDLEIELPPIRKQIEIASILRALDEKIELNNQVNQDLEEMAQAIFRSWFIDYEPFSGQEFEHHEGIGEEIPQDWDIKQMSQIARTVDCLHSKKPDKQDEGRFYIEVNDIGESGELQLDDKYLISEKDYKEWTRRITAKEGDVIISKTGRVGAVAQIPEGIEGAIGRNIVCIRPATEELSPAFLKEYMISTLMREEIGRKTLSGTVLESLHVKEIENLRVVVPPKDVRERFEETVGHLHTRINHNIKENENLKQIRDTLLPKLMSGEIRVNDIDLEELEVSSEV
jgi:type I restriction enzyme S subunit